MPDNGLCVGNTEEIEGDPDSQRLYSLWGGVGSVGVRRQQEKEVKHSRCYDVAPSSPFGVKRLIPQLPEVRAVP